MIHDHYWMLEGKTVVDAPDMLTWAKWFGKSDRNVAHTPLANGYRVSTVFLGIDHNFCDIEPPLIFETMTFPSDDRQLQQRYSTWDEAEKGHAEVVLEAMTWKPRRLRHLWARLTFEMRMRYLGWRFRHAVRVRARQ